MEGTMSPRDATKFLDDDIIIHILKYLVTATDIANVSRVSRSWRQLVLEGQLWRALCHHEFPELERIEQVIEIDPSETAGCSTYEENLRKHERVYRDLYREIKETPLSDRSCIRDPIAASSTDKFPHEGIHETLHPYPRRSRDVRESIWSYWSSTGTENTQVPETLTYRLLSSLCVVHEVKVRPFEAVFQSYRPIYSSKYVRFRFGYENPPSPGRASTDTSARLRSGCEESHSKKDVRPDGILEFPWAPGPPPEYTWTYVSPEYPMKQVNELQTFKLPRPVLCMGKIMQVELLERVQTQLVDDLYYICVCHVCVIGKPLRNFGFAQGTSDLALSTGFGPVGGCGLICQRIDLGYHEPTVVSAEEDVIRAAGGGRNRDFAERIRELRLSRGFFPDADALNRLLEGIAVRGLLLATEQYLSDPDDEEEMSEEELEEDDDLEEEFDQYLRFD